jgi:hypothetical protein
MLRADDAVFRAWGLGEHILCETHSIMLRADHAIEVAVHLHLQGQYPRRFTI